jgi:hypothetical protein
LAGVVTALAEENARLTAALATMEEERACAICLDAPRCTLLLPCRHVALCGAPDCAAMLGVPPLCPMCRKGVDSALTSSCERATECMMCVVSVQTNPQLAHAHPFSLSATRS